MVKIITHGSDLMITLRLSKHGGTIASHHWLLHAPEWLGHLLLRCLSHHHLHGIVQAAVSEQVLHAQLWHHVVGRLLLLGQLLRSIVLVACVSEIPLRLLVDIVYLNFRFGTAWSAWVDVLLAVVDDVNVGSLIDIADRNMWPSDEHFNNVIHVDIFSLGFKAQTRTRHY